MFNSKSVEQLTKEQLVELLNYHDQKYFEQDQPEISDYEYDLLRRQLTKLDSDNPVLKRVGFDNRNRFIHNPPMLSLDKIYDAIKILDWIEGKGEKFVVMHKMDGLAISLKYNKGKLVGAYTRKGLDLSRNIKYVMGVPLQIPIEGKIDIRGEAYISIADFNEINKSMTEPFRTPRILAAGSIKHSDVKVVQTRRIRFMAYDYIVDSIVYKQPLDYHQKLAALAKMNFNTVIHNIVTKNTLLEELKTMVNSRGQLPYQIDGIVIRTSSTDIASSLGATSHHPNHSVAYKMDPEMGESTVKDFILQIGRTGVITPKIHIKPVTIGDVLVSYVTLHNWGYVEDLEIGKGDRVLISRRGDVIPQVEEVIESANSPLKRPESCPACDSPVVDSGCFILCANDDCSEKIIRNIAYFADIFKIDGLSHSRIKKLFDAEVIKNPADLYKINVDQISNLSGLGTKSAKKLLESIHGHKKVSLEHFLGALGIKGLGVSTAKLLAAKFNFDLQLIFNELIDYVRCFLCKTEGKKLEDSLLVFSNIDGIGPITSGNIVKGLHKNKEVIMSLLTECGIKIIKPTAKFGALVGKTFCLTGTLSKSRSKLTAELEKLGAIVKKSITSHVDYLIAGDNTGKKKIEAAKKNKVAIISEMQLRALVKKDGPE